MMKLIIPFQILLICFSGSIQAAPLDANEAQEFVTKIERMREALKRSATNTKECSPPVPDTCSFEGYCGKLAARAQESYLYQDSEGHQIPNFTYLFLAEEAELCERKAKPLLDDPFLYPEMFVNETGAGGAQQLKKNKDLLAKEVSRSKSLGEEARASIIKMLAKRKNGSNDQQIENLINRVKSVKLGVVSPGNEKEMAEHGCELPNAAYDLRDHTIKICPQMLNMPSASILATLAHELGHSIDPCSAALDFTKDGVIYPPWMDEMGFGSVSAPEFAKMSAKANPFAKVISCLQDPSSIGVVIPSKEQLLKDVYKKQGSLSSDERKQADQENSEEESGADISKRDATAARLEDQIDVIKNNYEDFKGCPALTGTGHIAEAFADWVSSQVVADKISTLPSDKASEFAFSSMAVHYGVSCPDIANQSFAKMTAMMPKCETILKFKGLGDGTKSDTTHPSSDNRVNRIFLAKPEIKKALTCHGGETGTPCE